MDVTDLTIRVNQEYAGPRHVPGLEVDPDKHSVASNRRSVGIHINVNGQGKVFGETTDISLVLTVDRRNLHISTIPFVQLAREPRQLVLATQSPVVAKEDKEMPAAPDWECRRGGQIGCDRERDLRCLFADPERR